MATTLMERGDVTAPGTTLTKIGIHVLRYGLVAVLLWVGLLKFTAYEAEGIQPLVAHSPFMSWTYCVMSVGGRARCDRSQPRHSHRRASLRPELFSPRICFSSARRFERQEKLCVPLMELSSAL